MVYNIVSFGDDNRDNPNFFISMTHRRDKNINTFFKAG